MSEHPTLPPGYTLRPAWANDIWPIRKLVLAAKLDPTQLRWPQFRVIESEGRLVACGQLRAFPGVQELGSLVVAPAYRHQGLGTFLLKYLIQEASGPLYLECLGRRLVPFYTRCGFMPVSWQELPRPLKLKFSLSALAAIFGLPVTFMQYQSFSRRK